MPYSSYDHDKLEAAETMRIERRIYFEAKDREIAPYASLPKARRQNRRFLTTLKNAPPHGKNRREERFCWIKHLNM